MLDLYSVIFDITQDTTGILNDVDATIIIAVLTEKTGINNKPIKEASKALLLRIQEVWNIKKVAKNIFLGLNNKNNKAVAECLDIIA